MNSEMDVNSEIQENSEVQYIDRSTVSDGLHSALHDDFQDESRENLFDELDNYYEIHQSRNNFSHQMLKCFYQLDLSVLCLLKKFKCGHKYPSITIKFEDSEMDKFNNIVLCYRNKSVYIQIEYVDQDIYMDNTISFAKLFTTKKPTSINNYFNSFVKYCISKSDNFSSAIEYLVIYTNSSLDLTDDKKLSYVRSTNFYPFKFVNTEKCDILNEFLCTNGDGQQVCFYQFSNDKLTRDELSKRLEFSSSTQKIIEATSFYLANEKEIKDTFFNKLVFAVKQPNREELLCVVKNEAETVKFEYMELQGRMFQNLTRKKFGFGIVYEFNVLLYILHEMFLNKKIAFINCTSHRTSNFITIYYKRKVTYMKTWNVDKTIGYAQLFPSIQQEKKDNFSINSIFHTFINELEKNEDVKFFIIFINANLDLTEENRLKKDQSNDFHPFKFEPINIQKKRYKVLRNCSFINKSSLYMFAQEELVILSKLLKFPIRLQKGKEKLMIESEQEIKVKFSHKLIFAVKQPSKEELDIALRININKTGVLYDYKELHEIALRWLECPQFGPISERTMRILLDDIKNNRLSCQKIENQDLNEEIAFAKGVVGLKEIAPFNKFLDFLIKGEGSKFLNVLKRERVQLSSMSSILHGVGHNAPKAFKDLYDLWFDKDEKKTQYLKTVEKELTNLTNISSILNGAGCLAAQTFKDLYDLLFDEEGNKTQCLKLLEKEGLTITNMSSILNGAGTGSPKAFKDLFYVWFDEEGNKTKYLKSFKDNGISMSCILHGAGSNAVKAFKDLYYLWFDEEGNKTDILRNIEQAGIDINNVSSCLLGAGPNAASTFKGLYSFWFDEAGNKTQYLKALQDNEISIASMLNTVKGTRSNAAITFKSLYYLWFDENGNKAQCLKNLEEVGINVTNLSTLIGGAGVNSPKAFKSLYNLWFDEHGNKTQYLEVLEQNEINIVSMFSILRGAGCNAAKALKDLCDLWFDEKGQMTRYLKSLEKEGITSSNMSNILYRVGSNAAKTFKGLYDLWFDEEGNKTQYLTALENNGINLSNLCNILCRASSNVVKGFKDLHTLWFDEKGNKTHYLQTLANNGVELTTVFNILHRTGCNAPTIFTDLYSIWFDEQGNKTPYLNILEKHEINLFNMCSILDGAGTRSVKTFKDLYNLWFDEEGNETQYLTALRENQVNLVSVFSILSKSGSNAVKAFKDLHDIWFDSEGKKTRCLQTLDKNEINLSTISTILYASGSNSARAFKDLYDVWFDEKGNETKYLTALKNNGMTISDTTNILCNKRRRAAECFKELCKSFLDDHSKPVDTCNRMRKRRKVK